MGKITASIYVTLDGVVESPAWTGPYFNDKAGEHAHELLFASDALLLGRLTYEGMAKAWPTMTHEGEFAERMNSIPKHVASSTLTDFEWNATGIAGDVVEGVRALKESDQDLLIYGSAGLVNTLFPHGLIDEYRLWLAPVVQGTGRRLFDEGIDPTTLELIGTRDLGSGALVLSYKPAEK
ncbi:dihydrofolate reductase family protein [Fodinicola feengrottensis]|uniref:Dihydrofolate reductase family protein n=1 Tax=Fodinicola feengrottensis TaxID=435914 RepID=A0ABN2H7V7_9ACTN|nr:dihydrofolate reductase family protein [Fodinicola feengrottensis]